MRRVFCMQGLTPLEKLFIIFLSTSPKHTINLKNQQLASYLSCSERQVCYVLSQLIKTGLLEVYYEQHKYRTITASKDLHNFLTRTFNQKVLFNIF